MYCHRSVLRSQRVAAGWLTGIIIASLMLVCVPAPVSAQEPRREQPSWWFGVAGAANLNFYGGTTQRLNATLTTPAAFHKGFGPGLYLAPLVEYRFDPVWGIILQAGYDDRRGSFYDVPCPCGENSSLSASPSYISIEPSIRVAPFSDGWYLFAGPRVGFSWSPFEGGEKEFIYTREGQGTTKAEFSNINSTVYSGQIGIGYDIALVSQDNKYQFNLSPFISYQPYFGQEPRSLDSWAISTIRVGAAIKFGSGSAIPQPKRERAPAVVERDVTFSVRAPLIVPVRRRVRESFPVRNYVFFEEGSVVVPNRYVLLTKDEAAGFNESQLQTVQPRNFIGRSARQMTVYYNILNVLGDRMRQNPKATVLLSGASEKGPEHGKARAETIKKYLVDVFGIDGSRITTEGRDKPRSPSIVRGATKELALLAPSDRRVDIISTSPEVLIQVGTAPYYPLRPVQIVDVEEDPLDAHVLFHVDGASEVLASWSLEITESDGKVQRFGPSTRDRENLSGNVILGDRSEGDYTVVLLAQTKGGTFVRKERPLHLVRRVEPKDEIVRFSILFDYDESHTVAGYETFLTETVTPLIQDSSLIIIHGYTDNIGEAQYNEILSQARAQDVEDIIRRALSKANRKGVTFETFGFGEDAQYSPFDNYLPEGRFFNRSVIIDIIRK